MQELLSSPAGRLVPTIRGQKAFVPNSLPRELNFSPPLVWLLDQATLALGTLAGAGRDIPNPHLLIRPLQTREALMSSRIEGIVTSLSDVFSYEAGRVRTASDDAMEVVNYVRALEFGVERLEQLPISLRLLNEMHRILLYGVRGQERHLGRFRQAQVWIGPPGSPIEDARFVPPPPEYLRDLFYDCELFINDDTLYLPPLIRCGMIHYQFEAIHPYEDGNGRIGRLLIALQLIASGMMSVPLLYMSAYFERNRARYYSELLKQSVTGDWEQWLTYFLAGVLEQAQDAQNRIQRLHDLRERYRDALMTRRTPASALQLTDQIFASPITTVALSAKSLGMTDAGARRVLDRLVSAGILHHDRSARPQQFVAREIISALEG